MVKQAADTRAPSSVLPQLAKLLDQHWRHSEQTEKDALFVLASVRKIVHEGCAIKLRIARVLVWASSHDVSEVGSPNWAAFVKEYAPWDLAQARVWMRVVRSRLFVIMEALQNCEITLDHATRAVQTLSTDASEEAQQAFLLDPPPAKSQARNRAYMDCLDKKDRACVLEARKLGRLLIGSDAPVAVIDNFLIDCHERKRTCKEILEDAHEAPPVPERLGKVVPDWTVDPAEGLLGAWVEPTDIRDAAARLRRLECLLAIRRVAVARAYQAIRYYALWTYLPDCDSVEEACATYLGMSQRTLERYANEGLRHDWFPKVRKEVEAGRLTIDRANYALSQSMNAFALERLLDFVKQIGRAELEHSRKEYGDEKLRERYRPELAFAEEVRANLRRIEAESTRTSADAAGTPATQTSAAGGTTGTSGEAARTAATQTSAEGGATGTSGTATRVASYLRRIGSTGQIQVALRDGRHEPSPPRESGYVLVPPKLLAAAKYVLNVVVLPPAYGVRRTVAGDRYTCQNPRCRQRTLRVHPHHMHQRQHGGSDDPWNLITLCPACHLRGIHSDRQAVVRFDDFLVWTWSSDDTAVVMHSPVSELAAEQNLAA